MLNLKGYNYEFVLCELHCCGAISLRVGLFSSFGIGFLEADWRLRCFRNRKHIHRILVHTQLLRYCATMLCT